MTCYGYVRFLDDLHSDICKTRGCQEGQIGMFAGLRNIYVEKFFVDNSYRANTRFCERFEAKLLISILKPGDIVVALDTHRMFGLPDDVDFTLDLFRKNKWDLWLIDWGGSVVHPIIHSMLRKAVAAYQKEPLAA